MDMMIVWLLALIVSIVVEVATLGLTTIWFAGGAVIALILAILDLPIWMQAAAFVVVSLLLLFFTRPIAVRYFNKNRIRTNVEGMAGKQAIVTSRIDNLHGTGLVMVENQEWTARAQKEDQIIPVGAVVIVKEVSGVKLIVEVQQL